MRFGPAVIAAIFVVFLLGMATAEGLSLFAPSACTILKDLAELSADWPQLKRYESDNKTIEAARADPRRVVFLGDSITEYWTDLSPRFFEASSYIDRGIAGQTTPQMLLRFRQDVVKLNPRVVVLLGGINDIVGNTGWSSLAMIQDNIEAMVELSKAARIEPVLCSLLPTNRPWRNQKVAEMNDWLQSYAHARGIIYIDYHSVLVGPDGEFLPGLTSDGLHPNKAGYDKMEPLAAEAIALALKRVPT